MLKKSLFFPLIASFAQCNAAPDVPANPPPPNAPDFGSVTKQSVPPPPISGGTMLLSNDGVTAIVADPDRDFVSFVDLNAGAVRVQTQLNVHDEPGRVAEDHAGNVYVALRGTGELATFSLQSGALLGRRFACSEPRGVAYDAVRDQVLVACATGELVTFNSGTDVTVSSVSVERDMRDVVLVGDRIFVSKFRHAEILEIDQDRKIVQRIPLPNPTSNGTPALAWRMRLGPTVPDPNLPSAAETCLIVSYQIDSTAFVPTTTAGGYGNSTPNETGGIINTVLSYVPIDHDALGSHSANLGNATLPVDFAVALDDGHGALVAAGNIKSKLVEPFSAIAANLPGAENLGISAQPLDTSSKRFDGQMISAEVRANGDVVLQSREPAMLSIVLHTDVGSPWLSKTISLSAISRDDTGHDIFHASSGASIACASCHGEGGDDSQTWNFDGTKPRRTASLRGTVKGTAPYHWDADFADLSALTHEVYTRRMSGRTLDAAEGDALKTWLEQVPAPKRPVVDEASRVRGAALFNGAAACSTCHSGDKFTNNTTVDVGSGKAMQVPPLVGVGARLPLMHDGCATTLTERFTTCASPAHGNTANLDTNQVADLVTYLDSL